MLKNALIYYGINCYINSGWQLFKIHKNYLQITVHKIKKKHLKSNLTKAHLSGVFCNITVQ